MSTAKTYYARFEPTYYKRHFRLFDRDPGLYIQLREVARAVSLFTNIDLEQLREHRGDQRTSAARYLTVYLCRLLTPASFPELGCFFERDHSTMHHANQMIRCRVASQPAFARVVGKLRDAIEPKKEVAA